MDMGNRDCFVLVLSVGLFDVKAGVRSYVLSHGYLEKNLFMAFRDRITSSHELQETIPKAILASNGSGVELVALYYCT